MGPDHQWWKHQKPVHEQWTEDGQSESLEEAVEHLWSGEYSSQRVFSISISWNEHIEEDQEAL